MSSDEESSNDGSGYDPLLDATNRELIQAEALAIMHDTVGFRDRARKIIKLCNGDRSVIDDSDDDDESSSSEEGLGYVDDPPEKELTPWVFVDRETKIVTVFVDKEYIKEALIQSMEDDTDGGNRFKGWDKANNMGDSEFRDYMWEHFKGPRKLFHTPREAYNYMKTNYPEDHYEWILVYD